MFFRFSLSRCHHVSPNEHQLLFTWKMCQDEPIETGPWRGKQKNGAKAAGKTRSFPGVLLLNCVFFLFFLLNMGFAVVFCIFIQKKMFNCFLGRVG